MLLRSLWPTPWSTPWPSPDALGKWPPENSDYLPTVEGLHSAIVVPRVFGEERAEADAARREFKKLLIVFPHNRAN